MWATGATKDAAIRRRQSGKEFRFHRQFQPIYIDGVPFASLDLIPLQSAILFACVRTIVQPLVGNAGNADRAENAGSADNRRDGSISNLSQNQPPAA
jgi:hypothetical protein